MMATANGVARPNLTVDDIDDLIYACRTNELDELKESISQWSNKFSVSQAEVILSAIDVDEDGLGSRSCLLHYPAANGNLEMVNYLLQALQAQPANGTQKNGTAANSKPATRLVNHTNVSGNTPLHWAALNGHLEVVKVLVGAGADPTIVNEAGRDVVVEAEYSSIESAAECATWLLRECEALEAGTGNAHTADGVASGKGEDDMDESEEEEIVLKATSDGP